MNRLLKLQVAMMREIEKYSELPVERDETMDWEKLHMASCARLGYLMAEARGVDPDIAACACAVHDYGRIITGKQSGHAEAGHLPVKLFLKETGLFNEDEIDVIATAVRNHSKKSETGTDVEEIVKDADVVDCYQYGLGFSREEHRIRYEKFVKNSIA